MLYNGWSLFVRLVDRQRHREAVTSRPMLLGGVARQRRNLLGGKNNGLTFPTRYCFLCLWAKAVRDFLGCLGLRDFTA